MTANVSASNSTSLYQSTGNLNIGQSTVSQILGYFDNNGNVNFALDPATGYNQIKAYFVGTATSSSYGNANVAAFLPTYTGLLSPSSIFTNNYYFANGQPFNPGTTYSNANVAAYMLTNTGNIQAGNVTVLGNLTVAGTTTTTYTANLTYGTVIANSTTAATSTTTGAMQSYGGLGVQGNIWGGAVYTNNIYYANGQPFLGATIATLQSNAATQAVAINSITANLGAYQTWANANIQSISANLGAFEAYANTQFYSNANVTAFLPTYSGILLNLGAIYTDQYYFANGVPLVTGGTGGSTYSNVNVAAYLASGNLTSNIVTAGNITSTGNIQGSYILADGSKLTNLPIQAGTYSNSNVASYLPTYSGSLDLSSSVINLVANAATQATAINTLTANAGTQQTSIDGLTSNAATQASQIATLDANLGTATTNITTLFANAATQQTSIDNLSANAATQAGQIAVLDANLGTATTNITTLFANAATQQTSIDGLTSNAATQAGQIAVLDANLGTATTNITTLFANAAAQATSINTLTANAATQSIAIDSLATGANANTAAYLPGYTGDLNSLGNVTILGSLTSDDITSLSVYVQGNAIITGNLTVLGNTTTINSNVITTNDKNITVANNVTVNTQLDGAGLDAGENNYATWRYNYLTDSWQSNLSVTPTTDATKNLGGTSNRWGTVYAQTLASDTIDTINANLGTATTNITTLFSNAASQATDITTLFSNAATQSIAIASLATGANANTAAYLPIYGGTINVLNITGVAGQDITIEPDGAGEVSLNAATVKIGDNNVDATLVTRGTGNLLITTHHNDATQGNITLIDGANANIKLWPHGTGVVESAKSLVVQGNVNANYFVGDGSAVTNVNWTGNLLGNPLYDSVNGRVFANAWPFSTPDATTGGTSNGFGSFVVNGPTYVGGVLQPKTAQTQGFTTVSNVGLQSGYGTTRTVNFTNMYAQVTPVTANVMVNGDRARAHNHILDVVGGNKTWGTMSSASQTQTSVIALQGTANYVGTGELSNLNGVGSVIQVAPAGGRANLQYVTSYFGGTFYQTTGTGYTASNIAYVRLLAGSVSPTANLSVTNAVGLHTPSAWAGGSINKYVILNEDGPSVIQTAGNITMSNTSSYLTNTGFTNLIGNTLIGATDKTTNFSGNVNYNSAAPYVTTFYGNVVQGQIGSYSLLRGTTLVQGNIKFDSPYYETVNALGNQSGTLTINTGICNTFTMTLTGDITLNTSGFTNMIAGKSITLILTQDATGGRILSSNMKFAGGINTLSSAANAIDVMNIYYDGTNFLASLVKGYV